jgi:Secretion system C-terminal sorting domain
MKNKLLTILFGLMANLMIAQSIERQVIGATGSTLTDGTTATIDFTVGEVATTSLTNGATILTQGFQQGEVSGALSVTNPELLGVKLYPNPAISKINISGLKEKSSLNVYDINGRLVMQFKDYLDKPIDVINLQSAFYFIKIRNSKGVKVKTFIKE